MTAAGSLPQLTPIVIGGDAETVDRLASVEFDGRSQTVRRISVKIRSVRRLKYFSILLPLAMAACGGGSKDSTPQTATPASVKEALAQMEASGSSPALDRSTAVTGPDANADGIRDDVERYIASTAYQTDQKAALRQLSKAMSTALTAQPTNEASLRTATAQMNDAVACIWKQYPSDKADAVVLEVRKVTINTRERYDAYMRYNAAVAGTVVKLPKETRCE